MNRGVTYCSSIWREGVGLVAPPLFISSTPMLFYSGALPPLEHNFFDGVAVGGEAGDGCEN